MLKSGVSRMLFARCMLRKKLELYSSVFSCTYPFYKMYMYMNLKNWFTYISISKVVIYLWLHVRPRNNFWHWTVRKYMFLRLLVLPFVWVNSIRFQVQKWDVMLWWHYFDLSCHVYFGFEWILSTGPGLWLRYIKKWFQ